MTTTLAPRPCLEFHRKQAKALHTALNAGESEALARARAQHPRPEPGGASPAAKQWSLADAQLIVAREHGFPSWPKFQSRLTELEAAGRRAAVLVEAAVARSGNHRDGDLEAARKALAADPASATLDLYAACALGEAETVAGILQRDPGSVKTAGGPWGWEPLLYVCFSRFLRFEADREARFLQTARLLLDAGADPNALWLSGEEPHQERETALYGAAGVCNNAAMTALLLERGADPDDGEVAYHSPEFAGMAAGRVWWERNTKPEWRATALLRTIDCNHLEDTRWLLEHGADPDDGTFWGNRPLHQVLARGRGLPFAELLLDHGADPQKERKDGASVYRLAAVMGRVDVLRLLEQRGPAEERDDADRLLGACARGDRGEAARILAGAPGSAASLPPKFLPMAAEGGNTEAVRVLLDAGFDIETRGNYRATPLHHAAWNGRLETVRLLVERGASLESRHAFNGTALDAAVYGAAHYGREGDRAALVELLIAAGADVSQVASYPCGHAAVDAVLERHGAKARGA